MIKRLLYLFLAALIVFGLLQCIRPAIPAPPVVAEVHAPDDARHVLQTSCYSCHSNERRLAWFDEVVPAYWLVRKDILDARSHLNFSTLGEKPAGVQRAELFEAVNMVQFGAMPLPSFLALHPDARVNAADLEKLKDYLAPWGDTPPVQVDPAGFSAPDQTGPEYNGLAFDPSWKSWHLLSVTDRGDNDTFRFILGNDIAAQAAHDGHTHPWPDGARFAKVAWQQRSTPDGLVAPGQFIQIELMVKDAKQYKDTEGWGFGRWRGPTLKPYGSDASFAGECTGCHAPMNKHDFVYTMPISAAHADPVDALNNEAASYASPSLDPAAAHALTLFVDRKAGTMSVLYGNAAAASRPQGSRSYPAGTELLLITWKQIADPHWFGARIPGTPLYVESLQVGADPASTKYRRLEDGGRREVQLEAPQAGARTEFIERLAQAPALR
ncbi:MAG TPA: cytochrome P460 family protein [Acidobacteriaceae bacterium]|jgi:hypothetical protein